MPLNHIELACPLSVREKSVLQNLIFSVWIENLYLRLKCLAHVCTVILIHYQKPLDDFSKCYIARVGDDILGSCLTWLNFKLESPPNFRQAHHMLMSLLFSAVTCFIVYCVAWLINESWKFLCACCALTMALKWKCLDLNRNFEAICLCKVDDSLKLKARRQCGLNF
jgi:integral membrane sensor domain MASE1